ncbi:MAG: hypothetical protein MI742_12625 [Desulfobacterales bacterium]|nr:hypothetical protein [Desulfobacterales bacterium]
MMKDVWAPHEMVAGLQAVAVEPETPPTWLSESWEEPEGFYKDLKRSLDALYTTHGASALFTKYDFYHDIIGRNRNSGHPAMVWFDAAGQKEELSWQELGRLSAIKAAKWTRVGLREGDSLCLVRQVGLDLATDLLAALRLGAVISLLPLSGHRWMKTRLDVLEPKWISTDKNGAKSLKDWEESILPLVATQCDVPSDHRSFHGYATGDVVFRLFPAATGAAPEPVDVTSDTVYLGAARDGTLGLGLYPGMCICTPSFDVLQYQPSLLLSSLLCGATTIHITTAELVKWDGILKEAAPDVLGVTPELRNLVLEEELVLPEGIGAWFKDPVSSFEYDRWQMFASKPAMAESYSFNLRWDAAFGGSTLFSMRKKGMAHPGGLPMPGSLWQVGEEGSEADDLYQVGVLHINRAGDLEGEMHPTGMMLAAHGKVWLCTQGPALSRHGICYPVEEVEALLAERSRETDLFFRVVAYPRADFKGTSMMVLVGFTGARGGADFFERLKGEVTHLITTEMGEGCLPDRMGVYPIYPKFEAPGVPDAHWCRDAWISGALSKRAKSPVFQCITQLRARLMEGHYDGSPVTPET